QKLGKSFHKFDAAKDIAGIRLNLDIPKWMHVLHLEKFNSNAVQWLTKASKSEPTNLYTMEKGYFLLPESAKFHHNVIYITAKQRNYITLAMHKNLQKAQLGLEADKLVDHIKFDQGYTAKSPAIVN
ncbi:hypothetical protein S83_023503, partial [Arachis hypogaea]